VASLQVGSGAERNDGRRNVDFEKSVERRMSAVQRMSVSVVGSYKEIRPVRDA